MSGASDYGVALVDKLVIPALDADGRNVFASNDPTTSVADVIAYLLHWREAQIANPGDGGDAESVVDDVLWMGYDHYLAERGEGDDIAQGSEDHYRTLIAELMS